MQGNSDSFSAGGGMSDTPLTEQVKETAGQVMEQTREQTGQMVEGVRGQVKERLVGQKEQAVQQLDQVAQALHQTGQQLQQEHPTVGMAADRIAEVVEQMTGYLRERDLDEMMGDVQSFARTRPALFFGGAFALGFLAARFIRTSSPDGMHHQPVNRSLHERGMEHPLPTAYDRAMAVSGTGASSSAPIGMEGSAYESSMGAGSMGAGSTGPASSMSTTGPTTSTPGAYDTDEADDLTPTYGE